MLRKLFALTGLGALLVSGIAGAASASGDGAAWCGTHRTGVVESLARHAWNQRRLERLDRDAATLGSAAAATAVSIPDVRAEGDVAVIVDDGTIVADRNPFDFASRGVRLKYIRKSASYRLASLGAAIGTNLGQRLDLGDDDAVEIELKKAVRFFGEKYDSVWVNSDGNLTFLRNDTASTSRDLGRALNGAPRIAPFFQDLNPEEARGQAGVYARFAGKRLIVTWLDVPQFGVINENTFQVEIVPNGQIKFRYGANMAGRSGIVGIFPGGGSALHLIDWSDDLGSTFDSAIAENFADSVTVDEVAVAEAFLGRFQDLYSHVIVFTDFPVILGSIGTIAWELTVKNQIRGIGVPRYDVSDLFGSSGALESFVMMGDIGKYDTDIKSKQFINDVFSGLDVLMHEIAHRWLLFANLSGPGLDRDALLGRGSAHWSFYAQSHASYLEGSELRDNGDGTFTTLSRDASYNLLDLYLMGFADADEVDADDFFYVDLGAATDADSRAPEPGQTVVGARKDFSVSDVIAAEGPREPDFDAAPKAYRMAVILLTRNGEEPSAQGLSQARKFAKELKRTFRPRTLKRGKVNVKLEPLDSP